MRITKRELKRIIREEYSRMIRRKRLTEGVEDEDEIIAEEESETLYITQYANGFVQIEKKDNIREVLDFDSSELPAVIAALQKMMGS